MRAIRNGSISRERLSRVVHRFGIYICAPVCDVFNRECLAVVIGARLRGEHVASELNRLDYLRGEPETVFCDDGAKFTGQFIDLRAHSHKVKMDFSRPGTPTDNAYVDSFNGTLQDEFLNVNW